MEMDSAACGNNLIAPGYEVPKDNWEYNDEFEAEMQSLAGDLLPLQTANTSDPAVAGALRFWTWKACNRLVPHQTTFAL
ncbi:hypothetical protein [Streptomyces synnematoformans]|uniref:Uncharacterized protein n=1 Tax=Streptomyces synnematoformans TaxID=415721 RepID=A0ABN2XC33_9ACTN